MSRQGEGARNAPGGSAPPAPASARGAAGRPTTESLDVAGPRSEPPSSSGPIRVLHTVTSLHVGGINRLLLSNIENLGRTGIENEVAYFLPRHDLLESFRALGVGTTCLHHVGLTGGHRTLARLIRLIRERDVDVLHCHHLLDRFFGSVAARVTGTPALVTFHDTRSISESEQSWHDRTRRRLADWAVDQGASALLAVSSAVKDVYVRDHGFAPEAIRVLHSGVNLDRFRSNGSSTEDRHELRRRFGIEDRWPVLLNVARLHPMKGQRYLPAMMAKLRRRWPNAHLLVAGDGELRDELVQMTRTEGVEDCITWLGSRSDVPALLEASDLFVFPSVGREGLPIALLEAMAAGKPIVGTAIGPVQEAVEVGVNGRLVPPRDASALAEAVTRVCSSEGQLERFGRASARIAEERFSSRRTARALADIYRSVAA